MYYIYSSDQLNVCGIKSKANTSRSTVVSVRSHSTLTTPTAHGNEICAGTTYVVRDSSKRDVDT